MLKNVVNDLNYNHFTIDDMICDNPKRSIVRNALSHAAKYACEYCTSSAVPYVDSVRQKHVSMNLKKYDLQKKDILNKIDFFKSIPGTSASKKKDE